MGSRIAFPLGQAGNIPGGGSAAVYLPRGDYTAVVLQNQCSSPGCLRRVPASFGSTGLLCLHFAPLTGKEEEIIHLLFQRLHKLRGLDWLWQDVVVQSRSRSELLIKTFQKLIWPPHSTHVIKAPASQAGTACP